MTFQNNDPNRPTNSNPNLRRPATDNTSPMNGWGIPAVVAAVVIIGGLFLYNSMGDRRTTTANNAPTTSQITPVTPTPTPAPAPATNPSPKQ